MELSGRQANAVLVVLAFAAVGCSGYAMWSVRQMPEPTAQVVSSTEPTTQAGDRNDDDSTSQTGPPTSNDDEATTSTSEAPTESEAASPTEQPTGEDDPTLAGWRSAWSGDDANLLVIGDGYSNLESQWVQLWAARQAGDRPTAIRHWAERSDDSFNDPIELSEGSTSSLQVWSASRDGTTIDEAADRVEQFIDASVSPDAVLISLGGSSGDEDIAEELDRLLQRVPDVPVVVAAGPAELYEPGVADDIVAWAEDNTDRVSLVDLREATSENPTAEEWALAFDEAVNED